MELVEQKKYIELEHSALIAAYLMYRLDLTDHGTNINGSWLTKDGEEVLAFLREYGDDWEFDDRLGDELYG